MSSSADAAAARRQRANSPGTTQRALPFALVAWLIPGAGHVLTGDIRKGVVFFVTLTAMFAIGIGFGGRLFPFQLAEWLVFLAAVAQWGLGLPRIVAGLAGAGSGEVIAVTYEYGNTFLMAGGLLNMLVVLDAMDRARDRRGA